jgi:release factor glutamine methyltransferase
MKVREAIAAAAARLAPVSETARLDAELLMAHALGVSRGDVLLRHADAVVPDAFDSLIARRFKHEPVAYITGGRAFWTIELEVGPGVLVPRPDSESLIEAAVAYFGERGPWRILDLGTGPGTLLLAALDQWPEATGIGVDASEQALAYARRNGGPRAEFRLGDWGAGLDESFDLILCNPPYVEIGAVLAADVADWEPDLALYAEPDGLEAYRVIAPQLRRLLAADGIACLEIGMGQGPAVREILAGQGFTAESRNDLKGVERCLIVGA